MSAVQRTRKVKSKKEKLVSLGRSVSSKSTGTLFMDQRMGLGTEPAATSEIGYYDTEELIFVEK